MKILILLLISFTASASYLPKSKVGQDTDGLTIYSKKNKCEKEYSETCIKINGEDISISKIRPEKWLKELAVNCSDSLDCQSKLEALVCSDKEWKPIKTETEVYCTKFREEKVVDDDSKKAIKDAEIAAKEQEKLDSKAERQEIKAMIQTIKDYKDKCVDKDGVEIDLQPNWLKKLRIRQIKDMRDE